MDFTHDVAILGAGPGGMMAALYLKRFHRKVAVFEDGNPRARRIPKIRNLVGYQGGISGRGLLSRMKKQVALEAAERIEGRARVKRLRRGFEVRSGNSCVRAPLVILATGMRDFEPNLDNLGDLCAKSVLAYCPICDGYDHSGEEIGVLIRDGEGFHHARFIQGFSKKVTVIVAEELKLAPAHKAFIKRSGVRYFKQPLKKISYDPRRGGAQVYLKGKTSPVFLNLIYVAMGSRANLEPVRGLRGLRKTKGGFLITDSHQRTSIPGLFAVGDCVNALSQVSVAIGHAAIAATCAHNDLAKRSS